MIEFFRYSLKNFWPRGLQQQQHQQQHQYHQQVQQHQRVQRVFKAILFQLAGRRVGWYELTLAGEWLLLLLSRLLLSLLLLR
jgi:hypothetical protein